MDLLIAHVAVIETVIGTMRRVSGTGRLVVTIPVGLVRTRLVHGQRMVTVAPQLVI